MTLSEADELGRVGIDSASGGRDVLGCDERERIGVASVRVDERIA